MAEIDTAAAAAVRPIYASGECEIDLDRREIRVLGSAVPVGGRAFEIIEVLAQSAGQLVTKDELMHSVWPGAVVMDSTLHVHASAVRKALGPYRSLLKTESRRGYRLLGDWTVRRRDVSNMPAAPRQIRMASETPATNFPAIVTDLVGRSAAVQRLHDLISAYRIVTLTGPGGIGKTTLALQVARRILGDFADGGWLVEFASLSDPGCVPAAVAGVLGLNLGPNINSAEAVARAIGAKQILLVLDNCEHLIDAAANLAEALVRLCPRATIVATSREIFRIGAEYAYRVPPLAVPALDETTADQILSHSAAALFVTRARQLGSDIASRNDNMQTIAAICRHLDGIPLAIEFAAARAATLGLPQVAAALSDRFTTLKDARRNALPRHRTLRATLDWSYELLPDAERLLLQRLAIFAGSFSLDAANAVSNRGEASAADVADNVANLVAKSLVTSDFGAPGGGFRLLETTRLYALSKLSQGGELQEFACRHARYFRDLLRDGEVRAGNATILPTHIDNVRAALEWCFGAGGSVALGVELAAVAAPAFLAMSLFPECHAWSERAIAALDDATIGGAEEMHLQIALGVASMHLHGQSDAGRGALTRGLAIAQSHGDVLNQVGLLGMLSMFEVRDGNFTKSLHHAELSRTVAGIAENSPAMALANSTLGRALQFVGQHGRSHHELQASLQYWSRSPQTSEVYLGLDHHILVGIGVARNLWIRGYPAQAIEQVRQAVRDAERKGHPASLGLALSWAPGLFLWSGDLPGAEEHADWLLAHAQSYSLRPYQAVGRGYRGALAIAKGDAAAGVEGVQRSLEQMHAVRYRMRNTCFKLALVQGLMRLGLFSAALASIEETIDLVNRNGDLVCLPDALRMKGKVLLAMPTCRTREAEACFAESLDWSRRQDARSWQLRTAVDLATLWAAQGEAERARSVLQPIFDTFSEGFATADLQAARCVLATLR